MTPAQRDNGRVATMAARALFGVALVASTWGYHQKFHDHPPYLDHDSATIGIFVNNESFRSRYDEGFAGSALEQDRYRARWAASFLPATVVLSALQSWLGVPPDRVGDLLKIAGLVFGALGTLCVALVASRHGRSGGEILFLFGLTASLPAFLLFLRTAVPHFLFSYLMFWLATLCIDRYLDEGAPQWCYALAATVALYALVPYVPIVVLPVVAITLVIVRGAVARTLRDPHLYVAAIAGVALFMVLRLAVALTHEPSLDAWAAKSQSFAMARTRHAISARFLDPALLPDKLAKLAHQHFFHRRDELGDPSRDDALWTLPEPHAVWLALVPLVVFGAWRSLRRRDRAAAIFATVLAALYGFALTLGFPEGRYLIPAVPALAFFVLEGLRGLVPAGNARLAAFALVLAATAANSWILVRGEYDESMSRNWRVMAGMRETLAVIRDRADPAYGRDREINLAWPGLGYESWLYLQMLANMRARPFSAQANVAETAPGESLFAAVDAGDSASLADLRRRGYHDLANAVDPASGRELVVLAIDP